MTSSVGVRFAAGAVMRTVLLLFCLLPATACLGSSPSSPTPIDSQLVLAPGQAAQLASGVSVRFVGVIGDSRCPGDALCIQGGDAIVRVDISSGRSRGERDLHTGNLLPVRLDDLEVRLVELAPYPFSSRPFDPSEYRATLRVIR
jgi:hypothetical protein